MFSPPKSAKYTLLQQRPTRLHMVAYNTGGLKLLYKKLKTNNRQRKIRIGDYTDETGAFAPEPDMPPMARRYRFLRILGKGQSSVLVKVQDMFQGGVVRAVKVLHTHYTQLGVQESDCLRRINLADPYHMSATLRLCNTFSYHGHYCMTFETLCPEPITYYFVEIPTVEVISAIRKVALRLLQAIGFLQQQNVIHADLKPANILLEKDSELSSVKVVDFGNAIHCIHEELSLYYEDFELQTLLYRAPEVVFGLPFGLEVDMWGLGCVLAELYLNRPLFRGSDKPETLTTMTDFLGLLPEEVFKRGKFFSELSKFTSRSSDNQFATTFELMDKLECDDYPFVDFLRLLLLYNPHERMTVAEAARHPFLAPELALGYVMSTSAEQSYPSVPADHQNYTKRPFVDEQRKRKCLSSTDLLREGTCDTPPAAPKIARIVPILKLIKHDENNISNNNNNNNNNNNKNNNNNNNKYFGADCERRLARRHLTGAICPVFQPHVPMRKIAVIERPKARYPRSRAAYPSHVNDHQAHASSPHVGSESCKPCHHNGSPEVHSRDRMESVVHCRQGQCQHRVQCQYHRNWRLDGCSDCHGRHDGMDDRCHGACVHDLERPGSNAGVLDLSTSYPHPLNSCSDLVPLAYEYIGDSPQLTIPPTQPEAVYHGRHAHLSPSNKPSPRVQVGQRGCCRPSKPMSKHLQNASLNSTFVIQSLKPVSQQSHEARVKRTKSVNSTGETRDCSSHSSVPEPVKADTSKRRGNPAMISKQSWDVIQPIVGNGAPSTVDDQMEAPIRPVVSHVGSRAFKERTKMKTCKPHQLWVEELSAEEALYAVSEGVKSAKGEAIKQKVQRKTVHTTVELVTGKGAHGAVVDELKPANKIAIKTKAGGKMSKPIGVTVAPCVLTSVLTRDEEVVMCKKDDTTGLAKEPCQRFSYIPIVFETEDVKAQGPPLKKAKRKPRLEDCPVSTSATNTGKWVTPDRAATIPKSNCKTNRPAQKRQKHSAVKEVERPVQDRLKEAAVTGICAVKEEGDETVVLADGPSRAIMPKTPSKSTTSPKPPSSSVGSSAKSKASRGKSSKHKKSKRSTCSIVKARKYRTPTTNKSQARNSSDEWDVSSDEVVLL